MNHKKSENGPPNIVKPPFYSIYSFPKKEKTTTVLYYTIKKRKKPIEYIH